MVPKIQWHIRWSTTGTTALMGGKLQGPTDWWGQKIHISSAQVPRLSAATVIRQNLTIHEGWRVGGWRAHPRPPQYYVYQKKGKLRTIVDCRQRNDNTIKDITPFPDQDQIRMDDVKAKYHSKSNLSNAYEQVQVESDDVWKMAFTTIFRSFISQVMQQRDRNAPAMFQHLMTVTFWPIGLVFFSY